MLLDWQDKAACKKSKLTKEEYEWFFPPENVTGRYRDNYFKKAKTICMTCPVRVECLEYAMTLGSGAKFSVWGGKTGRELTRARKAYFQEKESRRVS